MAAAAAGQAGPSQSERKAATAAAIKGAAAAAAAPPPSPAGARTWRAVAARRQSGDDGDTFRPYGLLRTTVRLQCTQKKKLRSFPKSFEANSVRCRRFVE